MFRTSFYLPETLRQRLQIASERRNVSVSKLVHDLLDKALEHEEKYQIQEMYSALQQIKGIGKDDISNASTSIDEVLYGEQGAWRGSQPPDEL